MNSFAINDERLFSVIADSTRKRFLHDISPVYVVVAFRENLGDSKASFVESKRK